MPAESMLWLETFVKDFIAFNLVILGVFVLLLVSYFEIVAVVYLLSIANFERFVDVLSYWESRGC